MKKKQIKQLTLNLNNRGVPKWIVSCFIKCNRKLYPNKPYFYNIKEPFLKKYGEEIGIRYLLFENSCARCAGEDMYCSDCNGTGIYSYKTIKMMSYVLNNKHKFLVPQLESKLTYYSFQEWFDNDNIIKIKSNNQNKLPKKQNKRLFCFWVIMFYYNKKQAKSILKFRMRLKRKTLSRKMKKAFNIKRNEYMDDDLPF